LIVGIDVHKHNHAVALIDERGAQIRTLWLPNRPAGYRRLIDWLIDHQAADAIIGVESPGSYGRCLVAALTAAGFEVLHVPAWRTHRERHRRGQARPTPETPCPSPTWCSETGRSLDRPRSQRSSVR
jgi:transposase